MKKVFTPQQKAFIALEAVKGDKTISQIASIHEVHPTQVQQWKKIVSENVSSLFSDKRRKEGKSEQQIIDELYRIIGQRDMEIAWLKKKLQIRVIKKKYN